MLIWSQEATLDPEDLEEYFIIERDSGEPDSEGRLTDPAELREIPPELDEQLKVILKALKKSQPDAFADKRKRGDICRDAVYEALTAKLKQYPDSIQEDEELLQKKDLLKRRRMAIEVRLGEKKLLQEAIALVQGTADADTADDERATKKAKSKA